MITDAEMFMDLPLGCISASGLPKAVMSEEIFTDCLVHWSLVFNIWIHGRAISKKDVVLNIYPTTEEKRGGGGRRHLLLKHWSKQFMDFDLHNTDNSVR